VRSSSIAALGKLLPMITRVDQIITEVLNSVVVLSGADMGGSSNDILINMGVKSTLLEALALVCTNPICSDKITMPVRLKVVDACQQSLLRSDEINSLEISSTLVNLNLLIGDFMGKALGGLCKHLEPPVILSLLSSFGEGSLTEHFSVIVKRILGVAYALQGLQLNIQLSDSAADAMAEIDDFKQQKLFPLLKECFEQDSGSGDDLLISEGIKTCAVKSISVMCHQIPGAATKDIKRTVRTVLKLFGANLANSCTNAFSAECKIMCIDTIKLVGDTAQFSGPCDVWPC
jgi:hypothetical protein